MCVLPLGLNPTRCARNLESRIASAHRFFADQLNEITPGTPRVSSIVPSSARLGDTKSSVTSHHHAHHMRDAVVDQRDAGARLQFTVDGD
jgi:hypothetical protein